MIKQLKLLLFLIVFFCNIALTAQKVKVTKDSLHVYRKIEKYADKRKFTRFLHRLVFAPVNNSSNRIKPNAFQKIKKTNYLLFEGKIIRKIKIVILDPFGNSDIDSTQIPKTFLNKTGNALHLKTKILTIRNLLLIRKNEHLDSLLVKESERLIRTQRFITSITTQLEIVSKDSVDVSIRVLDSWSLIPDFDSSTSKSDFRLTDKNFLGLGHEFSNSFSKSLTSAQQGFTSRYTIPNISNTYISATINYNVSFENNYEKSINIERPFFSPYARWAAGINLGQNLTKQAVTNQDNVVDIQNATYNFQDYWAGHSFRIFKGSSELSRATNFISSARYSNINYVAKPFVAKDSLNIYDTAKIYLIGFGVSSRKYTQDKYIFNFNIVEDIASGFVYNFTTGYQKRNNKYQFYGGARIALGNYFKYGYLSGNLEYGTFVDNRKAVQSTTSLSMIYFTNIKQFGKWKVRQFVKPSMILGTNRLNSTTDRLTLNGDTGILGFDSASLFGTKKVLLSLQTQSYSPLRLFGFRLNPYFSYTGGILGNEKNNFSRSKLYSQVGIGMILSNDFLVFSAFQFSLSYYPNIPDGNSPFKSNSISTDDFGLQDFNISKPNVVEYK